VDPVDCPMVSHLLLSYRKAHPSTWQVHMSVFPN